MMNKETRKRGMEPPSGEAEDVSDLDLSLKLSPPGTDESSNGFKSSSPSPLTSPEASCASVTISLNPNPSVKKEEGAGVDESGSSSNSSNFVVVDEVKRRRMPRPTADSLVVMGCKRCCMYVMVSESEPQCPICKTTIASLLIDIFRGHIPAAAAKP